MIRKCTVLFLALLLFGFLAAPASATNIDLYDWGFNIDGTTYCLLGPCDSDGLASPPTGLPGSIDASLFNFTEGLGSIEITIGGAGTHYVGLFVDHELDEVANTFYNEYGAFSGGPVMGQSWEIDEPGYVFGDIFDNFLASTLDKTNGVPAGFENDVSMAIGWDFSLAAGETAEIGYLLGTVAPGGFYLAHTDPDSASPNTVYFSSTLEKKGVGVPEPGTMMLLGTGLVALVGFGRKRF